MARITDVAAYILEKRGQMTAMKLQKLVYYSQAWSLVWDDRPLFADTIRAWANGPVAPSLYDHHRGQFGVGPGAIPGDPMALTQDERETVDAVLGFYGHMSAQQLSDLTHRERPWRDARGDTPPGERCNVEITHEAMAEYYGSISLG